LGATNLGQCFRRFGIDSKSLITFFFTKIDIGKRGRIDEHIKLEIADLSANLFFIREIELRVIKTDDIEFAGELAHERRAESSAGTNNDDSHFGAHHKSRILTTNRHEFALIRKYSC